MEKASEKKKNITGRLAWISIKSPTPSIEVMLLLNVSYD